MNIKEEIISKMKYIEEITQHLGDKLKKEDYYIEDMGCPHNQPKKLPEGYSAIYIFVYETVDNYEYFKIGKANAKSNARYTSQHYGFNATSTLAKSLCNDNQFISLGINEQNVKLWMLNNLHRINILIKSNNAITELVEAVLHYAFRPRDEGDI